MSISNELRKFADAIDGYAKADVRQFDDDCRCIEYQDKDGIITGAFTTKWFHKIADRIDNEMVDLPRDVYGKPIHIGDTVYPCDGPSLEYEVNYIEYRRDGVTVGMAATGIQTYRKSSCVSHERPDSLERIADELDEMVDSADPADDGCEKLADLADRIRKLAEKESGHE